ncbi:SseB family protein [Methanobrevibacter sp.]|uniref:SseB family protein n=1 Tax=Methanobrevibacter sp. TaxID=66852 RepID=UPI003863F185
MGEELTAESQKEFLDLFKKSQLFMPVTYSPNMFEGIENAKEGDIFEPQGQVGFDINYLTGNDGSKAVPLFTSDAMMEAAGARSSSIAIFMSDLADMLKQSDRYSAVAVNPFTEHDIVMPIGMFLSLFHEPTEEEKKFIESLNEVLKALKEHSVELEENITLFFRHDENVMVENAVDGVFVPQVPFSVSSNPKYGEGFKYTNILMMPASKRILPIGRDAELDIIIAPGTEFKLQDTLDGTQNLWMCGDQPFYDE